jgi:hypothetical protein
MEVFGALGQGDSSAPLPSDEILATACWLAASVTSPLELPSWTSTLADDDPLLDGAGIAR